jgi:hypothetical protein
MVDKVGQQGYLLDGDPSGYVLIYQIAVTICASVPGRWEWLNGEFEGASLFNETKSKSRLNMPRMHEVSTQSATTW